MVRSANIIKNSIIGVITFIAMTVTSLFAQRIFISKLGYELLGLNATLVSIITTLSIAELGVGSAIVFSLYKPLAENDEKKVAALITLFRKIYLVIGLIVIAAGLIVIPFLGVLTKHKFELSFLIGPYLLFLLNSFLSYLFTYNHTLLSANQQQYMVSLVISMTKIVTMLLQILLLYKTKNYVLYLSINVLVSLILNLCLTKYVKSKYSYINKHKGKLTKEEIKPIKENVSALMYQKIGNYLVVGTDNLIISAVLGTIFAGYYSNYLLLCNALVAFMNSVFLGVTSAFGNLIATEEKEAVRRVFINAKFSNFFLYAIATTGIFVMIEDILGVWLTKETILPMSFLIVLCINYFISGYSSTINHIRTASGVFRPDRFIHITVALINLILSLIFVRFMGITGVLIGTTVSLFIREVIVLPLVGQKYIYGGRKREYYISFALNLILTAGIVALCWFIYSALPFVHIIPKLVVGFIICVSVPVVIISLFYFRTEEYKYLLNMIKRIFILIFRIKKKEDN